MPLPALPIEGSCRCGQVRMKVSAPPMITMACHCTGCQRMTSSAFSLSAMVPAAGFEITQGEPVIGGLHGADSQHWFCPHCMSWMFTRAAAADWFVNVRATLLDDTTWAEPFMETCTSEKLPWATTPARHSFARFPEMSDYEGLMKAYAEQAGS